MASTREFRLRIRSIRNLSQVTRALQAVSASRVRKAMQAVAYTRPYSTKAWQVLTHLAAQPGHASLHPLLNERTVKENALVVLITGDRGLAGAYTTNVMRFTAQKFDNFSAHVGYISVGRKGRDLLYRRRKPVIGEYSHLPAAPVFADVSAIGRQVVDEFLSGKVDQVFLVYTQFINMLRQVPTVKQLLPLQWESESGRVVDVGVNKGLHAAYTYEPGETEILDEIVPRFTQLQIYQAILESLASEHAARMVAMKNATDAATELANGLQLQYNNVRQQNITNEMLDIVGGANALGDVI
jgi:F-type H+-transporting ATPase subunit gamma